MNILMHFSHHVQAWEANDGSGLYLMEAWPGRLEHSMFQGYVKNVRWYDKLCDRHRQVGLVSLPNCKVNGILCRKYVSYKCFNGILCRKYVSYKCFNRILCRKYVSYKCFNEMVIRFCAKLSYSKVGNALIASKALIIGAKRPTGSVTSDSWKLCGDG